MNNNLRKIWFLVLAFLVASLAAQLFVTTILAGRGSELANLEQEASQLTEENGFLRNELAQKSSLGQIAQKATELGFSQPGLLEYLNLTEEVAGLPEARSPLP